MFAFAGAFFVSVNGSNYLLSAPTMLQIGSKHHKLLSLSALSYFSFALSDGREKATLKIRFVLGRWLMGRRGRS
jgi:hypothetical protein